MTSFAEVLRELRTARSLTQEELADRAGVTVKAVSALERGERRRPYPHTVRSLADALELGEDDRTRLVGAVPTRARQSQVAPSTSPASAGPTHLLGRDQDVEDVARLLDDRRLVTLTGPGGVGKTSLALAVADRVADSFASGAVVVPLAAVADPRGVLPAVAAALRVPEGPRSTTGAGLAPYLEGRRMLLLLDNVEHVLGCAADVAELVGHSPDLVVLATSRAPLRVRVEHERRVAPLGQTDAVALFHERAGAAVSGEAETVDRLCREAEGIPLAIELAASAAATVGAEALLDRVGGVGDGPRDLPARQRSMEATLDWSIDLLDPASRDLLGRLSVLPTSFTAEAAVAVHGGDALPHLRTLLEHSLAARAEAVGPTPRFRLLEPVRQHARNRWPDQSAARAGVGAYTHAVAVRLGDELRGSGLATALDLLDADLPIMALGVEALVEQHRGDDAAELLLATWLHLGLRGHVREGLGWVDRVGDAPMSDLGRARWSLASAGLHHVMGDTPAVRRASEAAYARATREPPSDLAVEAAVLAAASAAFSGDLERAALLVDEGERTAETVGHPWARAHLAMSRGQLALLAGDLGAAEAALREGEQLARELGNPFTLATMLNILATVSEMRDEHETSAVLLAEATTLSVDVAMSWTLAYALPALAGVAVRVGDAATGARLFGASASYAARHDVATTFQATQDLVDRDLAAARATLGEDGFRREWDAGRAATIEDVAELADELTLRVRG